MLGMMKKATAGHVRLFLCALFMLFPLVMPRLALGEQVIALVPFWGAEDDVVNEFLDVLYNSIGGIDGFRPRVVDMVNLPPDVPPGGFPPFVAPALSLTLGDPFAVTGNITEDPAMGRSLRLFLWQMADNRLLFSEAVAIANPMIAAMIMPFALESLFGGIPGDEPPQVVVVYRDRDGHVHTLPPGVQFLPDDGVFIYRSAEGQTHTLPPYVRFHPGEQIFVDTEGQVRILPAGVQYDTEEGVFVYTDAEGQTHVLPPDLQFLPGENVVVYLDAEGQPQVMPVEDVPPGFFPGPTIVQAAAESPDDNLLNVGMRVGTNLQLFAPLGEAETFNTSRWQTGSVAAHISAQLVSFRLLNQFFFLGPQFEIIATRDFLDGTMSFTFPLVARLTARRGNSFLSLLGGAYLFLPIGNVDEVDIVFGHPDERWGPLAGWGYALGANIGHRVGPGFVFMDARWHHDMFSSKMTDYFRRGTISVSLGYEIGFMRNRFGPMGSGGNGRERAGGRERGGNRDRNRDWEGNGNGNGIVSQEDDFEWYWDGE